MTNSKKLLLQFNIELFGNCIFRKLLFAVDKFCVVHLSTPPTCLDGRHYMVKYLVIDNERDERMRDVCLIEQSVNFDQLRAVIIRAEDHATLGRDLFIAKPGDG